MSTGRITVALADLHLALAATTAFAGDDRCAEHAVVYLSAGQGRFTMAATDGYLTGRVRKPATGGLTTAFSLDRTHAELLGAALTFHLDVTSTRPVTLTVTDRHPTRLLTVDVDGDFTFRVAHRPLAATNLDRLLAAPMPDTTPHIDQAPLLAERITPLLTVAALAAGEPLHGPDSRGLVQLGDWFTGLLPPTDQGHPARGAAAPAGGSTTSRKDSRR